MFNQLKASFFKDIRVIKMADWLVYLSPNSEYKTNLAETGVVYVHE